MIGLVILAIAISVGAWALFLKRNDLDLDAVDMLLLFVAFIATAFAAHGWK